MHGDDASHVLDALHEALGEEMEAHMHRQVTGTSVDSDEENEAKPNNRAESESTETGSAEAEEILEALELAEAEALERQCSGEEDDHVDNLKNDVADARAQVAERKSSKELADDDVPTRRRSASWSVADLPAAMVQKKPQPVAQPQLSSEELEALQDALAEAAEFHRQESGADSDHEELLKSSMHAEEAHLVRQRAPSAEYTPIEKCPIEALEEAHAEMHDAFLRQTSGEEDDHLDSIADSIAHLKPS